MQKIIITELPDYPEKTFFLTEEEGTVLQMDVLETDAHSILGNIYIGKIKNIASNIGSAFVEIEGGQLCHVPLADLSRVIYTNRRDKWRGILSEPESPKVRPGDELLIQVTKEAIKTKLPGATGKISLTGTYLVLTAGKCMLGLSGKLSDAEKDRLRAELQGLITKEYGFIVRTNAEGVLAEEIRKEAAELAEEYEQIKVRGMSRSCFSCVYQADTPLTAALRSVRTEQVEEILTDMPKAAEEAKIRFSQSLLPVRLYDDTLLPLYKLYSIEKVLDEALKERVWLKSGGYLVIQPTEALTVIDVNTGKFDGKKKPEETYRKINKEAALEVARQLRLRNLSGIILVDFIDMKHPDHIQELTSILKRACRQDPVKTVFVDFTKLGLAEITRKKVKKSLKELLI